MKYKFFTISLLFHFALFAQDQSLKLNHIYFVLDSVSFKQIINNTALQTFSDFDEGMPNFNALGIDPKTIYMRGKNTYVEIMGPNNKFKEPIGAIGIGFSWDTKHPFNNNIAEKLKNTLCSNFEKYDATYSFNKKKLLWYTSYYMKSKSKVATWYAFYNPEFLTALFSENYKEFKRNDFLKKSFNPNKNFIDISEIVLQCNEADYLRIKQELSCLGNTVLFSNESEMVFEIDTVLFTIKWNKEEDSAIKKITYNSVKNSEINVKMEKVKFSSTDDNVIMEFE